jgi:hypothetical protein
MAQVLLGAPQQISGHVRFRRQPPWRAQTVLTPHFMLPIDLTLRAYCFEFISSQHLVKAPSQLSARTELSQSLAAKGLVIA